MLGNTPKAVRCDCSAISYHIRLFHAFWPDVWGVSPGDSYLHLPHFSHKETGHSVTDIAENCMLVCLFIAFIFLSFFIA